MKIERFEDIICWKKAGELSVDIYSSFSENRDYGFRDQIQRASISVMNNIAEGFERRTDSEFKHFLYVAKGSCGEVRSRLYIARKLKYIDQTQYKQLHVLSSEISKIISGLIKTL
jgi:four helix bundle protein